jgi:uncharacterized protein YodC (DUF2158 family)
MLRAAVSQRGRLAARQDDLRPQACAIEPRIGHGMLFARCMSQDGLIALAIDDAGPALSALANDLLPACYGSRFTLAIRTLVEAGGGEARGEAREGFDLQALDGASDESKSVNLMSGGKRVWISTNASRARWRCIWRNRAGRRYAALFSDEADGALDGERTCMFVAMKHEVLQLGGYRLPARVLRVADAGAHRNGRCGHRSRCACGASPRARSAHRRLKVSTSATWVGREDERTRGAPLRAPVPPGHRQGQRARISGARCRSCRTMRLPALHAASVSTASIIGMGTPTPKRRSNALTVSMSRQSAHGSSRLLAIGWSALTPAPAGQTCTKNSRSGRS